MQPIQRKIIHCDCDCFYASVEMRDDPRLLKLPLAIGGKADQRGVIATCNYAARKFGVRSAMPTSQALKRCPDLVVMAPNMEKYRIASRQILSIYRSYTDLVEPLSLDEAYLDVSHTLQLQGSATRIAQEIRHRIANDVGITVSAGVAPNKFLAKIAISVCTREVISRMRVLAWSIHGPMDAVQSSRKQMRTFVLGKGL
ncbi:MAG: DNA polymerase IV, partial [Candidatus Aquirickettsiella gammari]